MHRLVNGAMLNTTTPVSMKIAGCEAGNSLA
jgi:hypothetical protein